MKIVCTISTRNTPYFRAVGGVAVPGRAGPRIENTHIRPGLGQGEDRKHTEPGEVGGAGGPRPDCRRMPGGLASKVAVALAVAAIVIKAAHRPDFVFPT